MLSPEVRLSRALASLQGLSVGDAFGEQFFLSFEMALKVRRAYDDYTRDFANSGMD